MIVIEKGEGELLLLDDVLIVIEGKTLRYSKSMQVRMDLWMK